MADLRTSIFFTRIRKIAWSFRSWRNFHALLRGVLPSIEHLGVLERLNLKTIIDIGANKGQFALLTRMVAPDAHVISFEPLRSARTVFQDVFKTDDHVTVYPYAIGSKEMSAEMFVTERNDSSSLLRPTVDQENIFGTVVREVETADVIPLGSVLMIDQMQQPSLIKIDVQGSELDVIEGSIDVLRNASFVYVELSYLELYRGQALAPKVIDILFKLGFDLAGVYNQHSDALRGPTQADFLFASRPRPS